MKMQPYESTDVGMRPATRHTKVRWFKVADVDYAADQQLLMTSEERNKVRSDEVMGGVLLLVGSRLDLHTSAEEWAGILERLIKDAEDDAIKRCLKQEVP